ncbi:DNA polymerase III subunit alpha [Chitinophaga oryzae]|uniref:DNA polymerase III subunit alpha n=1 Tax=Chitinophaga oryzae TaxID=2725414 RepID=A0AAE6ZNZ4_9BACT|nr:DNA polymerase III subunit alpha [Chitinophaga oryzae]QJB34895.1 DNA polymerase III subunit alpha [Chitinophaga oryzae]QJB41406.1 DNA polymerase III subunit alpha [Chitinophaga oryzae]
MLINCHTYYSLRYGTIPVADLVDALQQEGYDTAVLTDINNSTGVLEFIRYCRQKGFNGLGGIEFRHGNALLYIGVARNNAGFQQLNEFLTEHNLEGKAIPAQAPELTDAFFIYPFRPDQDQALRDNEYIGIRPEQLTRIVMRPKAFQERLVIWAPVSFLEIKEFKLHCQLRAIDHNILLSQLQPSQAGARNEVLLSQPELISLYSSFPQIIINTSKLLEQCRFDFDFTTVKNKKTYTGNTYNDRLLLEKLALDGWKQRYGEKNRVALERVQQELAVIDRLGFSCYFLITWDVIRYSAHRGFYHVGRGSGANSVVAYCLRITDVCPLELDLYFERFLNPKRKTPPDFDIDFSWRDRDEVFEYIFMRYGKKHTALLGMMSTFKDRSIIREIAKVYGLPKGEIDRLIEYPASFQNRNEIVDKIMATYEMLPKDFPNLRSIHAGGVLISELPITAYVALDLPPKGLPTTQFDMYTAEDIGFEKLDILSQRGIGHIKEAVEIIRQNQEKDVDVHAVATIKSDVKVNAQLQSGDSIGCFYIESPAMRGVLKKLRCSDYLTLVAASSIIRPGVGSSGMMDEYIKRYHNPHGFTYLHPILKEQLSETFGVMIYQEDVLKIGHHFGGLDLADADVLRRLMSGKNRGRHHLEEIREKFFGHCAAVGHDAKITAEVWRQMESFAGYSFSKAHSASYAVESYQSLFLKAHYPIEFMTAVINNEGGFYARWLYVTEARKAGATINLPCVNYSELKTRLYGKDIFLGFNMVDRLEVKMIETILEQRKAAAFSSLEDFVTRCTPGLEQLLLLVSVGALRFTGETKKSLLWKAHLLLASKKATQNKYAGMELLFQPALKLPTVPNFEWASDEDFYDEMELLGFSVSLSPFFLLKSQQNLGIMVSDLLNHAGAPVTITGLFVTMKQTRTRNGETMAFGTFLDRDGQFFDTVHFPHVYQRYPFQKSGIYRIQGTVTTSFGFPSITVESMSKLPIRPDPRFVIRHPKLS